MAQIQFEAVLVRTENDGRNPVTPVMGVGVRRVSREMALLTVCRTWVHVFRFASAPNAKFWKIIDQPESTRSNLVFPRHTYTGLLCAGFWAYFPCSSSRGAPQAVASLTIVCQRPLACHFRQSAQGKPSDFRGQSLRVVRLAAIGPPGPRQQVIHIQREWFNQCTRPVIAHTAMPAGVGVRLGSIHTDQTHLSNFSSRANSKTCKKFALTAHPCSRRNLRRVS